MFLLESVKDSQLRVVSNTMNSKQQWNGLLSFATTQLRTPVYTAAPYEPGDTIAFFQSFTPTFSIALSKLSISPSAAPLGSSTIVRNPFKGTPSVTIYFNVIMHAYIYLT